MFVVRVDREDEVPDFKVFMKRSDAERRFNAAAQKVWSNEFTGTALFEVAGTDDVRKAVEAVKAGNKNNVRLLEKEPKPLDLDGLDLNFP